MGDQDEKALLEAREKSRQKFKEKEARRQLKIAEKERKNEAYRNFLTKLQDPETIFEESFWMEFVSVVKIVTSVQAVYVGVLDEEGLASGEVGCIRYDYASRGSEWMTDKVLSKDQGVT